MGGAVASDEGIRFTRIPVAGAAGRTRENVEALDRLLDGASPEEALALGREAGLRGLEGAVAEILARPR